MTIEFKVGDHVRYTGTEESSMPSWQFLTITDIDGERVYVKDGVFFWANTLALIERVDEQKEAPEENEWWDIVDADLNVNETYFANLGLEYRVQVRRKK